jgi:hypothetical protein
MNEKEILKQALNSLLEKVGSEHLISSSEPIKRKIKKGLIYKSISEEEFYEIQNEVLKESLMESVFDPIQNTRSVELFDENEVMKPEAKNQIMSILNTWKEQTEIEFEIVEARLIGSMSGFQYNNTADIDINLFITLENEEDIWKLRKVLPNGNNLEGTSHPINFWVGTSDDPQATDTKRFENIYNLLTDTWEKKSEKKDIKVPYAYVMEIAKFFMDGFDLAISETERDIVEVEIYMSYDPSKQQLSEKEKREFISGKLNELRADVDRLKVGKHILRSFMVQGYEGMPFKVSINYKHEDPRYSMNSMVYKAVDRLGYHDEKLPNAINKASEVIKKIEAYLSTEVIE